MNRDGKIGAVAGKKKKNRGGFESDSAKYLLGGFTSCLHNNFV